MDKFGKGLDELISGIVNLKSDMPEINRRAIYLIAKRAVEIAKEKIREGDFDPISPETPELTKKLRGVDRGDGPPLTESGKLAKSLRVTANTVAMGKVYVEIGSDLVYAAIHEYGGTTGGAVGGDWDGYIPPRPYLRPAIQEAILEAVDNGLDEKIALAYDLAIQKKNWKKVFD